MTAPNPMDRTSSGHKMVDGVQFHSYRVGVLRYASITEDGRARVTRKYNGTTYFAIVDGQALLGAGGKPKRFRSQDAAMKAAAAALRG